MNCPRIILVEGTDTVVTAAAALAVVGNKNTALCGPQVTAVTVVVIPVVSVTVPTAFERPSMSCLMAVLTISGFFSARLM
jgi:hypothetical protein